MRLLLRQLDLGPIRFDERFALAQLELTEEQEQGVEIPDGVRISGSAQLASEYTGEIRLKAQVEGTATAPCDRCLEPITMPLDGPVELSYEPGGTEVTEGEIEVSESDPEVGYYEGDGLELADVVREQVLLALPMQKLCRPDCQGICPTCGQNRNESACQCKSEQTDDRWAALQGLKKKP